MNCKQGEDYTHKMYPVIIRRKWFHNCKVYRKKKKILKCLQ